MNMTALPAPPWQGFLAVRPLGSSRSRKGRELREKPDLELVGFWKRCAEWSARTRVGVGIVLALLAAWLARPSAVSLEIGMAVASVGLVLRSWAAGHLRKNQELAVSGPFAYVRNPLYLGSLIAGLGLGIATARISLVLAILAVFLIWYLPVVGEEERHLRKILPGYRQYGARVPRLIPSLTPRWTSPLGFDWKLYVRNREYSAWIGFAVFVLVLWLKMKLL